MTIPDPPQNTMMTAFFAAASAVESERVGEVEIEERVTRGDVEVVWSITVRREVRHFHLPRPPDD